MPSKIGRTTNLARAAARRNKDDAPKTDYSLQEGESGMNRHVFPWVDMAEGKKHKTITSEEVVQQYGVPRDVFQHSLGTEIREANSCKSLPFTLLLVASYASVVIMHDRAPAVNAVEDSLGEDIRENANFAFAGYMGHKGVFDINSFEDFWSWMGMGVAPLLFKQEPLMSEGFFEQTASWEGKRRPDLGVNGSKYFWGLDVTTTGVLKTYPLRRELLLNAYHLNSSIRGLWMSHNRIIGGIRMSQERFESEEDLCKGAVQDMQGVYNMDCVGGQKYELPPEMWDARSTADDIRARVRWLYIDQPLENILDILKQMELDEWIDKKTQKVEIAVPVYNAEYGIFALLHLNFFFSRGGHIWKAIIPLSCFANFIDTALKLGCDILFCCCLLWMLMSEVIDVWVILRTKGVFAVCANYSTLGNLLDWISVMAGGGLIAMFSFVIRFQEELNLAAAEIGFLQDENNWEGIRIYMPFFMEKLEQAVHYYHKFRLVMAAYPMVIVFRLFKTFSAQARLAVVTKSLSAASVDLMHFLLIFFSIFGIYSIAAVALFGHSVDDYATMMRTLQTVFLMMLGGFDWEDVMAAGSIEGSIWFWTFMLLCSFVLLNMLIAIVMDAYNDVKEDMKETSTVWEEVVTIAGRFIEESRGGYVPLSKIVEDIDYRVAVLQRQKHKDILERIRIEEGRIKEEIADLKPIRDEDYEIGIIHPKELCRLVPGMTQEYALSLMTTAVEHYYEAHCVSPTLSDMRSLLGDLLTDFKKLKHTIVNEAASEAPAMLLADASHYLRTECQNLRELLWSPPEDKPDPPAPQAAATTAEQDGNTQNQNEEDNGALQIEKAGTRSMILNESSMILKNSSMISRNRSIKRGFSRARFAEDNNLVEMEEFYMDGEATPGTLARSGSTDSSSTDFDNRVVRSSSTSRFLEVKSRFLSRKSTRRLTASTEQQIVKIEPPTAEDLERRVLALQDEVREVHADVDVALAEVSEWEWKVTKAHEDRLLLEQGIQKLMAFEESLSQENNMLRLKLVERGQRVGDPDSERSIGLLHYLTAEQRSLRQALGEGHHAYHHHGVRHHNHHRHYQEHTAERGTAGLRHRRDRSRDAEPRIK